MQHDTNVFDVIRVSSMENQLGSRVVVHMKDGRTESGVLHTTCRSPSTVSVCKPRSTTVKVIDMGDVDDIFVYTDTPGKSSSGVL